MRKIVPNLWFESAAEEAAKYYVEIFDGEITDISHYGEGAPLPAGTVLTISFRVHDMEFTALNGGPADFKFDESISFLVNCSSQAEVDDLWKRLSAEGEEGPCGWLKDKYGVSWQIIPTALTEMLNDEDRDKANRVMQAMLKMSKIEIAELEAAYNG